jgi:hypothetical protein
MTSPLAVPSAAALDATNRRLIPFDYQFQFDLLGQGRVLRQTVVVSIEAAFTTVAIGYGVIPDVSSVTFGPDLRALGGGETSIALGDVPLSAVLSAADHAFSKVPELTRRELGGDVALRSGIQLNPDVANLALQGGQMDQRTLDRLFRIAGSSSSEMQFLYALFDEGTGRAFQSDPLLNIAGLGISDGERPFRHFSPPIVFAPLATIGLEITEVSNFVGKLFVTLQGYKVLGGAGSPTAVAGHTRRRTVRRPR